MSVRLIYYKNDNLVELLNLRAAASSTFVNAATVTLDLTLRGSTVAVVGSTTAPSTGPIALTNFSTSGDYRGTIPSTAPIKRQEDYTARITANGGAGLRGYWEVPLISRVRST